MPNPTYLTTQQVAESLVCSVRTVHRMVEAGELVPVMQGPGLRGPKFFDPKAVQRIARQRHAEALRIAAALDPAKRAS